MTSSPEYVDVNEINFPVPTSASLKELVNDPEKESPATNPLYDKDAVSYTHLTLTTKRIV